MRRLLLAAVVILLAALPFVLAPRVAHACSCAGITPPAIEFQGEALESRRAGTMGRLWRFEVASGRGVAEGEVVEVDLAVPYEVPGGVVASSCDVGDAPTAGHRYRVGAYQGHVNGQLRYFAGGCGGYLQAVDAKVGRLSDSEGPPAALLLIAGAALAAVASITVRAARSA